MLLSLFNILQLVVFFKLNQGHVYKISFAIEGGVGISYVRFKGTCGNSDYTQLPSFSYSYETNIETQDVGRLQGLTIVFNPDNDNDGTYYTQIDITDGVQTMTYSTRTGMACNSPPNTVCGCHKQEIDLVFGVADGTVSTSECSLEPSNIGNVDNRCYFQSNTIVNNAGMPVQFLPNQVMYADGDTATVDGIIWGIKLGDTVWSIDGYGFAPYGQSGTLIISSGEPILTVGDASCNFKHYLSTWHQLGKTQCVIGSDHNPSYHSFHTTVGVCKEACEHDPRCKAIEFNDGGSPSSDSTYGNCVFMRECQTTEYWGGGSVYFRDLQSYCIPPIYERLPNYQCCASHACQPEIKFVGSDLTLTECIQECEATNLCVAVEMTDGGSRLSSTSRTLCSLFWACQQYISWGGGSSYRRWQGYQ